jgi:tRNA uridine 5-carboxymethylaminomethyl modification enzyme
LVLRIDNADLRLTAIGREAGMIADPRWEAFLAREARLDRNRSRAMSTRVVVNGLPGTAAEALARPLVPLASVQAAGFAFETAGRPDIDAATLEAEFKYRGYLKRHDAQRARVESQHDRRIPDAFDYREVPGLSREVVERLSAIRPATLGQASRIPGVTPAAVAVVASRVARWRQAPVPPENGLSG